MAFGIGNEASVAVADQSEVDSVDVDTLVAGFAATGVASGCAVTAVSGMDVAVASGTVMVAGVTASVTSGNLTLSAADILLPRFDLIVASSAGVKSVVAGTPALNPVFPAPPANSVLLAAIYVGASATVIASDRIADRRVMIGLETPLAAQARVDLHSNDPTAAHAASAIAFTPDGSIAATDVQAAIVEVRDEAAGGSGAPTTADYLVGTAQAGLSAEIVVGATPGGELGGTWGSPTVDASHGGGTHAATQTAAETTAATAAAAHLIADSGTTGKLHIRVSEPPPAIHVSPTGDNAFVGSWDRPKLTVAGALTAIASGGVVEIGAGTFSTSASLLPPALADGSVTIRGRGANVTKLTYTGSDYAFKCGNQDGVTRTERVYIEDMRIEGTSAALGVVEFNGVSFGAVRRCSPEGFTNASAVLITNVPGTHCYYNVIEENDFKNAPRAIYLRGSGGIGGNSNTIKRNHFNTHSTWAIELDAVTSNVIEANEFDGSIADGVRLNNACAGNVILSNKFDPSNTILVNSSAATDNYIIANTGSVVTDNGLRTTILQGGLYKFTGIQISAGTGTPEGVVTAPVGSLWLRTNSGVGTTLYIKEVGTGNTGWSASGADLLAHISDTTAVHGFTDTANVARIAGELGGTGASPTVVASHAGGTHAATQAAAEATAANASNLSSGTVAAARLPALTGDVTSSAGSAATTLAAGSAANLNSGTLPAGRLPALTGDVTSSAGSAATTIAASAVTLAKLATQADQTFLGNVAGSTAVPAALTVAQVITALKGQVGGLPSYALKTVIQTHAQSNTAFLDENALALAIGASETWWVEWTTIHQSSTVADIKFAVTVPSGTLYAAYPGALGSDQASWSTRLGSASGGIGLQVTSGTIIATVQGLGVSTPTGHSISALVLNGATPGNVTLQFAPSSSEATDTSLLPGCFRRAIRLA